jgi:hypothetical protein
MSEEIHKGAAGEEDAFAEGRANGDALKFVKPGDDPRIDALLEKVRAMQGQSRRTAPRIEGWSKVPRPAREAGGVAREGVKRGLRPRWLGFLALAIVAPVAAVAIVALAPKSAGPAEAASGGRVSAEAAAGSAASEMDAAGGAVMMSNTAVPPARVGAEDKDAVPNATASSADVGPMSDATELGKARARGVQPKVSATADDPYEAPPVAAPSASPRPGIELPGAPSAAPSAPRAPGFPTARPAAVQAPPAPAPNGVRDPAMND